jgi:hypothetical protein
MLTISTLTAPEPTTLSPITHFRSFTTNLDNLCTRTLSSLGHQESPLDAHEAEAKSYYIISLERYVPSFLLRTCLILPRWQAFMFGHPLAIAFHHFDTQLPSISP